MRPLVPAFALLTPAVVAAHSVPAPVALILLLLPIIDATHGHWTHSIPAIWEAVAAFPQSVRR